MLTRASCITVTVVLIVAAISLFVPPASKRAAPPSLPSPPEEQRRGYTVEQRIAQFGSGVAQRMRPAFEAVNQPYPPRELAYIAFKDSRQLEVYARTSGQAPWRFIKRYPIRGASGELGPKLREGDMQVPEGIYRAESLNPNSGYHLSVRVDYPNEFDREMARHDRRDRLGGDIMIHGGALSIGCLAMGDEAAEDLFVMAALAGRARTRIVISPTDFRLSPGSSLPREPIWTTTLYRKIAAELGQYESQAQRKSRSPK